MSPRKRSSSVDIKLNDYFTNGIVLTFFFFFWNSYRFTVSCKEMFREIPCPLPRVSTKVNILHSYSTITKLRNWHCYRQNMLIHISPDYIYIHLCVSRCQNLSHVALYNHLHSQVTHRYHHTHQFSFVRSTLFSILTMSGSLEVLNVLRFIT